MESRTIPTILTSHDYISLERLVDGPSNPSIVQSQKVTSEILKMYNMEQVEVENVTTNSLIKSFCVSLQERKSMFTSAYCSDQIFFQIYNRMLDNNLNPDENLLYNMMHEQLHGQRRMYHATMYRAMPYNEFEVKIFGRFF